MDFAGRSQRVAFQIASLFTVERERYLACLFTRADKKAARVRTAPKNDQRPTVSEWAALC